MTKNITGLSSRQIEILHLYAHGHTALTIAKELFLSVNTINNHRKVIIKKMKVSNITHAVARAVALKIVNLL